MEVLVRKILRKLEDELRTQSKRITRAKDPAFVMTNSGFMGGLQYAIATIKQEARSEKERLFEKAYEERQKLKED